jgi:CelD/BcsL family acetyltransferase involved in cellulose biosynthesis
MTTQVRRRQADADASQGRPPAADAANRPTLPAAGTAAELTFRAVDVLAGDDLSAEWSALLAAAGIANPFLSPRWCRECARHLPAGERPLVLAARDDGDRLVAVMPALIRRRLTPLGPTGELAFLPEATSADHADIVAAPAWAGAAAQALAREIAGDRAIAIARFSGVRQDSAIEETARRLVADHGWRAIAHPPSPCPRLVTAGAWDDYLARLGRSTRRRLRQWQRECEVAHESHARELTAGELAPALDWLEEAHRRRWGSAGGTVPWSWRVLAACAREPSSDCRVRVFGCPKEDGRVAVLATLWAGDTVFAYRTAFDPAWADLRPGTQVFAVALKAAFDEGVAVFDFLRGDAEHKRRWHATPVDDVGWTLYRPSPQGRAAHAAAVARRSAGAARRRWRRFAGGRRRRTGEHE